MSLQVFSCAKVFGSLFQVSNQIWVAGLEFFVPRKKMVGGSEKTVPTDFLRPIFLLPVLWKTSIVSREKLKVSIALMSWGNKAF